MYNLHSLYVRSIINTFIKENKYIEIYNYLYSSLNNEEDPKIISDFLLQLIRYNNFFQFEHKQKIEETLQDYETIIGPIEFKALFESLNLSPANIDLKDFTVEMADSNWSNVNLEKIKTVIQFSVPIEIRESFLSFQTSDGHIIEFKKIRSLFDDYVFQFLNSCEESLFKSDPNWLFKGMPLTILSDSFPNPTSTTSITMKFNEFYHPDFEIITNQTKYKSFEEIDASIGKKYYPHKERIIKILRQLYTESKDEFPLDISINKININLFSNYLVSYFDENNKLVHHKIYLVTNFESYLRLKDRYLDRINQLNLNDDFVNIRRLLIESHITNSKSLAEFIYKIIDLIVKKSIEKRGIYKLFWKDSDLERPIIEPEAQPIIKSYLQPILEIMGIQISREIASANGALDFHCSYTNNGRLLKTVIELKYAHSGKLLHGLTKQIKEYMDDEGTRDGIYLILWFRNDNFDKPSKYDSPEVLKDFLEENIPKKYRIKLMVIDCTKKPSPSKI